MELIRFIIVMPIFLAYSIVRSVGSLVLVVAMLPVLVVVMLFTWIRGDYNDLN